jgi:hypothetical protein
MDMMTRKRDASGQYTETVTLDAVLGVFDQVRGPVVTSSDVAGALDCTTEAARQKLARLEDRGDVESRKTGRTKVYWRTDSTASPAPSEPASAERGVTGGEGAVGGEAGVDTPETTDDVSADVRPREGDGRGRAGERIDELDLAGSGAKYDRRREAVLLIYDHLRSNPGEWFQKGDFREVLDGVDVGYSSFNSLWSNWVKGSGDKPNVLEILPGVELSGDEYQYHPSGESNETAAPGESGGVYDPTKEFEL